MHKQSLSVACPQCGTQVVWSTAYIFRPFCSERCKLIDLGEWADEENRIAGEKAFPPEETNEEE